MDKTSSETLLPGIVQAVSQHDAALFDVNFRKLELEELPEVWQEIANAHTDGKFNLTLVLELWLGAAPDSALELMDAMNYFSSIRISGMDWCGRS